MQGFILIWKQMILLGHRVNVKAIHAIRYYAPVEWEVFNWNRWSRKQTIIVGVYSILVGVCLCEGVCYRVSLSTPPHSLPTFGCCSYFLKTMALAPNRKSLVLCWRVAEHRADSALVLGPNVFANVCMNFLIGCHISWNLRRHSYHFHLPLLCFLSFERAIVELY
jgi:hypothetical protein